MKLHQPTTNRQGAVCIPSCWSILAQAGLEDDSPAARELARQVLAAAEVPFEPEPDDAPDHTAPHDGLSAYPWIDDGADAAPLTVGVDLWPDDNADAAISAVTAVARVDHDEVRLALSVADDENPVTVHMSRAAALEVGGQLCSSSCRPWSTR